MGRSALSIAVLIFAGAIAGVLGVYLYDWYFSPAPPLALASAGSNAPVDQTEAVFQHYLDKSNSVAPAEWIAAREDHRRIARAVAACKHVSNFDMISPRDFSALFLDLTPAGSHLFVTHDSTGAWAPPANAGQGGLELAPQEITLLGLSDTIARTRMAAASEADSNVPGVRWLGIVTLVVSALATLFVTVQGRMRPQPRAIVVPPAGNTDKPANPLPTPPAGDAAQQEETQTAASAATQDRAGAGDGQPPTPPTPPTAPTAPPSYEPRRQRDGLYEFFAYGAIFLSIAGTALTGVRQFYDPSRAYAQNEHALLALRQEHEQIGTAAGMSCAAVDKTWKSAEPTGSAKGSDTAGSAPKEQFMAVMIDSKQLGDWTERAAALRAQIIPAFAALPQINGTGDSGH